MIPIIALFCAIISQSGSAQQYNYNTDAILLGDVKVLTLYRGHHTTGRRSSPVPQLQCVGGTAGCSAFLPEVVQCQNVGTDGIDYQWECKADMDNKYRFGKISVSCEGYSHSGDPYILKGSCGLEYTLDLAGGGHQTYDHANSYSDHQRGYKKSTEGGSNSVILILCFVGIVAAVVWFTKTRSTEPPRGASPPPPYGFRDQPPPPGFNTQSPPPSGFNGPPPPPYGFKSERQGYSSSSSNPCGQGGLGGFWTGIGTGGLLGYLFGSRNNAGSTFQPNHGSSIFGGHSGTFGSARNRGWGTGSPASSSHSSPSGTRTASGFGGTKKR